jgi:hypothetical protein
MSKDAPAFPVADPFSAHRPSSDFDAKRLAEGMTLRQYAAIKLKVPDSGVGMGRYRADCGAV